MKRTLALVAALAFVLGAAAFRHVEPPTAVGKILAVTSATTGTTYTLPYAPSTEGFWQVEITGTATVILKGRISSGCPWVTLATRSASGGDIVPTLPEMQAECTAYTSGNVNAWFVNRGS